MPRVQHVAKARQRYQAKPIIDPATGQQKKVPVMKRGVQATSKGGRPVFRKLSEPDLEHPLPERKCDYPACPEPDRLIKVGTPFKFIAIKQQRGSREKYRHEGCPSWQVWEYSDSLSAKTAEIQHNAELDLANAEDEDGFSEAMSTAAEAVRELAEAKRESAQNIEEGFQHATSMSDELNDQAEQLDAWADEIEGADIESLPEPEPEDCPACEGTGKVETDESAPELDDCMEEGCDGGQITPEEPTEEQMEEWRDQVRDSLLEIINNCPV